MDIAKWNSPFSWNGSLHRHALSSSPPLTALALTHAFQLKQLHLVSQKLDFLYNYTMFACIIYTYIYIRLGRTRPGVKSERYYNNRNPILFSMRHPARSLSDTNGV